MRSALIGVVLLAVVATVVTATTGVVSTVIGGDGNTAQAARTYGVCNAMMGVWPKGGTDQSQRDVRTLGEESLQIAAMIITIGRERNLPPAAWQVALQAGRQESGLRNLTYGDLDSLGIFQIRGMHGSVEQRLDVRWQINWFYDTLTRIKDWERMRPGDAAQAVERSAFPDRYHRWEGMAVQLLADLGKVEDPTGCASAPPPSEAAAKAISFAMDQIGDPYVWGGNGPDAWDCSSLVQAAYRAAGVTIPRVTYDQWLAGAYIPLEQAQPGDLVFYGNSSNRWLIHHVGLYVGNGEMVEAPYTGAAVRKTTVRVWNDLIPYVVRPGV
ncbi:NlpC/P60 family protein [Streptoalloteichus tenebrarius]|uniref:NlpC/P60 family protein n=1 Tax=Streptoalloteichus tenebrarius (strain ATCC 17920 / DSM 40477 / JCM 4838 / CBS 697.72 / NBRC 16177 / NCIMB 11028 / NRRL B-12390 / A12253. 1 / ISP 5477) TaxID=1933 RepID=A0ABT1HVY5_STRSD|nr:NlpC/P60 family protein [Streptoalloteichus tenebrarius]MCP2259684.1 NlpC/P60 family protein [Streptoalloteichus tenebrarius]BFF00661.1 C40 family peptidase [Streptoalloteichus tenebrarius]